MNIDYTSRVFQGKGKITKPCTVVRTLSVIGGEWFYFCTITCRESMLCCRTGTEMAQIFKPGNNHYE